MAFNSSTKFVAKLDNSLLEEFSGEILTVNGSDTDIVYLNDDNGYGYQMKQNQYLTKSACILRSGKKASIGFWLFPVNPGKIINSDNSGLEEMDISILDISEGVLDPYSGSWTQGDPIVIVRERTASGGSSLVVDIIDSNGDTFTSVTDVYEHEKWHYFWIAFHGGNFFKVFIDGKESSLSQTGSLPDSINAYEAEVSINRFIENSGNVINNYGYIDDIVILNSAIYDQSKIQKIINTGIDFLLGEEFQNVEEIDFALLYDDPTAIRLTSVVDDGSFIYASRTDGKILQGSPLLWDTRLVFSNSTEKDVLTKFGEEIELTNGSLKITKGTIRL